MQHKFLTTKLSVVDLSPIYLPHEALEFMWRGAERKFGRLSLGELDKAMKIATRIEAEASTEAEARAIFKEMS